MTGQEYLNALACHVAWNEGRKHGVNGALAVLFCIKNKCGLNAPLSTGEALNNTLAFLYASDSVGYYYVDDIRDTQFQQFLSLSEKVLNGSLLDRLTNGAVYWGDVEKPLAAGERVATVGGLNLYK